LSSKLDFFYPFAHAFLFKTHQIITLPKENPTFASCFIMI